MNHDSELTLTVVMPALNEEGDIRLALENTLKAFDHFKIDGEVIVINDGSRDRTPEIIREVMENDERVRTLNHDTPQGIGGSFWEGVDHAKNNIIVTLPGDNENDPWEIFQYLFLMEHVDIVIPFIYSKKIRGGFRTLLSFLYRYIINFTFLMNLNYTNGTVLYRRSVLKEIVHRNPGFFFQTDILVRLVKKGYLYAEVPYRLGMRNTGESKAVSCSSLVKVIKGYLNLVQEFYLKPGSFGSGEFIEGSPTFRRYSYDNRDYQIKEKS